MISSIPTDLEQYSQRLIDYCDSLSASAYVNFHRLFLIHHHLQTFRDAYRGRVGYDGTAQYVFE